MPCSTIILLVMRFKITLIPDSTKENLLPINYQYPLASWVYKTIATGDRSYAEWLHANGFADGSKRFNYLIMDLMGHADILPIAPYWN